MTTISAEKARNSFSELLSHTAYSKDRVVVTRNGKKMVAIVSIEDLKLLERLADKIEDELDLEDIRAALREYEEGKTIPWETVKKDLGL
jgi:prevent-host-death family protein